MLTYTSRIHSHQNVMVIDFICSGDKDVLVAWARGFVRTLFRHGIDEYYMDEVSPGRFNLSVEWGTVGTEPKSTMNVEIYVMADNVGQAIWRLRHTAGRMFRYRVPVTAIEKDYIQSNWMILSNNRLMLTSYMDVNFSGRDRIS